MVAEEGKRASSQLWSHQKSRCPIFKNSPRTSFEWHRNNTRKWADHEAVYTFDLKIAQDRGWTFVLSNRQLRDYSVCHHAVRCIGKSCDCKKKSETEILFDTVSARVTDVSCATMYGSSTEKPAA